MRRVCAAFCCFVVVVVFVFIVLWLKRVNIGSGNGLLPEYFCSHTHGGSRDRPLGGLKTNHWCKIKSYKHKLSCILVCNQWVMVYEGSGISLCMRPTNE